MYIQSWWNYPVPWTHLFWYAGYGVAGFVALMAVIVGMVYLAERNDRKYGKPE
jgi:hypothetical protein